MNLSRAVLLGFLHFLTQQKHKEKQMEFNTPILQTTLKEDKMALDELWKIIQHIDQTIGDLVIYSLRAGATIDKLLHPDEPCREERAQSVFEVQQWLRAIEICNQVRSYLIDMHGNLESGKL